MAKLADAAFSGSTGKYDFEVYPLGTDFKNVGAVYIISRRTVDPQGKGTHTFIYIGHTGNLSERFERSPQGPMFQEEQCQLQYAAGTSRQTSGEIDNSYRAWLNC
jgi:hypothetical protein